MQAAMLLVIAVLALVTLKRLLRPGVTRSSRGRMRGGNPYHAVIVEPGEHCCHLAQKIAGQPILSEQAPRLPLPGCSAPVCHCHYRHQADRRTGRRAAPLRANVQNWRPGERRISPGRRRSDLSAI